MSIKIYLYKVLYLLVHYCFTILEVIFNFIKQNVDFCHAIFYSQHKDTVLCEKLKCISKPPKHLTILLGQEEPSYKDLANLVCWCILTRIQFISFYDYKGILKKHQAELEYEISQRKRVEDHIIWHNDPSTVYKNGFIGRKIHIKILSQSDGKQSLVHLCKKIASNEVSTDYSIDSINENLSKQFEFPDPELGLYCGKTFSLFNYPQWQIRVTEFLNIKTHHNITFDLFIDNLLRYSKCEQRLGR